MNAWLRNLSLKYKFWAVNAVSFATSLLLVLFALHLEQQTLAEQQQAQLQQHARLLAQWPAGSPLPSASNLKRLDQSWPGELPSSLRQSHGWQDLDHDSLLASQPLIAAQLFERGSERYALLGYSPSLRDLLGQHFLAYALCVFVLMLMLLASSQMLIHFILSHLHRLKDAMLHVEKTGDVNIRVRLDSRDEVGQMAGAFNAMQSGYQRVGNTVAEAAARLDEQASLLAARMKDMRNGMHGQQQTTDQAAHSIGEMTSNVHEIAQHAASTRDQSQQAHELASAGQQAVQLVGQSISGLSSGVQETAQMIQRLAEDSQKISSVVSVIHGIAEQTNLLALNAAIEAARAGEMGRGFAVVADEVRNLARRVQDSTDEITQMIQQLQSGTRDAVEFMQDSSLKADDCVHQADEAGAALSSIADAVSQMRDSNTQIATAAAQQTEVAAQMNRAVLDIRDVTVKSVQMTHDSAETSDALARLSTELTRAVQLLKL